MSSRWPLVRRDNTIDVPLVVVAGAARDGILQRVGGATQFVERARRVPHAEARLTVDRQLLDAQVGEMLGVVQLVLLL